MKIRMHKRLLALLIAFALLLELAPLSGTLSQRGSDSLLDGAFNSSRAYAAQSPTLLTNTTFLPLVTFKIPVQTVFGFETFAVVNGGGLAEMSAAKASWVRRDGIYWPDVETAPGVRNWTVLASLEQEMINASNNGMQMLPIVRGTPVWAQAVTGTSCGPILPAQLGAFGRFMHDMVARYSGPPFNVHHWEIWNEPDVDPTGMGNSNWGCWGNNNDSYFGGGYFAQMLQTIYPQIKASDPSAQVILGGLLLDCPATLSTCNSGSRSSKFLEGILRAGGGAYFDGVAFHAYDYYIDSALGHYTNYNWGTNWNTSGPVLIAKARSVKQQLQTYGVTGKGLYGTETAVVCICATTTDTFELTKAYYIAQSFASAMAEGLKMSSWYGYYGWRQSGLATPAPPWGTLPAYAAFQVARRELGDAQYSNEITTFPGVKGFAFTRRGHRLWLLWSLDGAAHSVTLPATPTAVQDALGNPSGIAGNTISVTIAPLWIEMP